MSFEKFYVAISNQIDRMISQSTELFYVEVGRDELFDLYLRSFPEGTNPIFRERTVHDCSCCKGFIRNVGHMVAIINGRIETIWDVQVDDFSDVVDVPYQIVTDALSEDVKFRSIAGIYRHREKTIGGPQNREELESGIINIYDHFYYTLPSRFVLMDRDTFRGNSNTNKSSLERAMTEISLEASDTVIELIDSNSLYRGEEFLHIVEKFQTIKREYDLRPKGERDMYLWTTSAYIKATGRFKNTVIGTLLHDLSTGTDLEEAVGKFESKVAPTNYKRPTALVTQAMIDRAEKEIAELGIEKSLARRYATAKDLTINNVIFADKGTKKKMKREKKKKSVLGDLQPTKSHDPDKIKKVNIDEFVATILPHAKTVEVMVDNNHMGNMMSVIAPTNKRSPNIMKWDNPFSWSYAGEVTDSIIKQRVKKAGGNVEGLMRISLSWHNHDDLDIHAIEPDGTEIWYGGMRSRSGGWLDVDMNAGGIMSREPVENIAWAEESNLREGKYKFFVEQFHKRETTDIGFQAEFELNGKIYHFSYDKPLKQKERVTVIEFNYSRDKGITVGNTMPSTQTSKEVWGIATHEWARVSMVLNSPNHWNGQRLGNRHFFFILDGCLNPDRTRGFYNEFLQDELRDHRKVFELVSSKMKTEQSDKQLSGVGFSSTQENSLLCRVSGKFDRTVMITFANIAGRFGEDTVKATGETVALCEVCKRDVTDIDSRLPCPQCECVFHTSHFLESVRVAGKCPVCRESVTQIQVNEIVQLVTV